MKFGKFYSILILFFLLSSFLLWTGCETLSLFKKKPAEEGKAGEVRAVGGVTPAAPGAAVPTPPVPGGEDEIRKLKSAVSQLYLDTQKLRFEIDGLKSQIADFQTEIIKNINTILKEAPQTTITLKNGSVIYGNIIYQDEREIKIKTGVGILTVNRDWVLNITMEEEAPLEAAVARPAETRLLEEQLRAEEAAAAGRKANCHLVGTISEQVNMFGYKTYTGKIINDGDRRADFVLIRFGLQDRLGNVIRTDSTFVRGTQHTYASGVTSDACLEQGQIGEFSFLIPIAPDQVFHYRYTIRWKEYD